MAAPTDVRVEAQSMSTTILRWTYGGSSNISVYRSTDAAIYAEVTDNSTRVVSGTTEYTDTGLTAGTKYYYKLSDDGGSSFSSVVNVYTHFCADQISNNQAFNLPRFDEGQEGQAAKLNELAERVERAIGENVIAPSTCIICPDDGAVVVDCTNGCNSFLVIADEDINSFTVNRCGSSAPPIEIYVPPSTTVGICGFPAGFGMQGDECSEAPISGGTHGRTIQFGGTGGAAGGSGVGGTSTPGLPKSVQSALGGSGGGSGGTVCECVPGENNQLTIKCCTANCSLGCASTKRLMIKVCGGIGPYTIEHTGSVKFETKPDGTTADTVTTSSKETNPHVIVVPPTNAGSAVAGDAYWVVKRACVDSTGGVSYVYNIFLCDDSQSGGCNSAVVAADLQCPDAGSPIACTALLKCQPAVPGAANCNCGDGTFKGQSGLSACDVCNNSAAGGTVCDKRTALMLSGGCAPCGVQSGSVITVTDAAGVSVSTTVKA
jgi:hypothetical protein